MTTRSQQQGMAQPEAAQATTGTAQPGAGDHREFWGAACGAGAGAAMIWRPITSVGRTEDGKTGAGKTGGCRS